MTEFFLFESFKGLFAIIFLSIMYKFQPNTISFFSSSSTVKHLIITMSVSIIIDYILIGLIKIRDLIIKESPDIGMLLSLNKNGFLYIFLASLIDSAETAKNTFDSYVGMFYVAAVRGSFWILFIAKIAKGLGNDFLIQFSSIYDDFLTPLAFYAGVEILYFFNRLSIGNRALSGMISSDKALEEVWKWELG